MNMRSSITTRRTCFKVRHNTRRAAVTKALQESTQPHNHNISLIRTLQESRRMIIRGLKWIAHVYGIPRRLLLLISYCNSLSVIFELWMTKEANFGF